MSCLVTPSSEASGAAETRISRASRISMSATAGAIMGGGTGEQVAAIDAAAGEYGLAFHGWLR